MPKPRWIPSDTQTLEELVYLHGPHKVFAHLYTLAKKFSQETPQTDEDRERQRECLAFIASMQD
jgi:hypothetical protein